NQWLQDESEKVTWQEAADAPVQEFLRQLAMRMTESAPPGGSDPEGQTPEVILELDLAGAHYRLLRSLRPAPATPAAPVLLSRREEEIARLIAKGYPNKTIAAELDISPWTVCTYIRRIFAKIGVGSRAAMVARLLEKGGVIETIPQFKMGGSHGATTSLPL